MNERVTVSKNSPQINAFTLPQSHKSIKGQQILNEKATSINESELLPSMELAARSSHHLANISISAPNSLQKQEAKPNETGLPDNLKAGVENLSGYSLDDVRVHYNSSKPAEVQALAYTQGTEIHVAPGQEKHLPHEAWHVVQQMQGRVKPTMQMKEVQINDDEGLEREADVKGRDLLLLSKRQLNQNKGNLIHPYRISKTTQCDGRLKRASRILSRIIKRKSLPINTYRWDTRIPDVIAQQGFQPWNPNGNIRLEEHVNNAFADGPRAGQMAKYESQWVSTGAYGMLKRLDPTFAQQVLNTNLYKIDTNHARQTGNFHDANDHFDKIGQDRPYPTQREWIKLGGIPPNAVIAWMSGQDFLNQYDLVNGAPEENDLNNWQPMPMPPVPLTP